MAMQGLILSPVRSEKDNSSELAGLTCNIDDYQHLANMIMDKPDSIPSEENPTEVGSVVQNSEGIMGVEVHEGYAPGSIASTGVSSSHSDREIRNRNITVSDIQQIIEEKSAMIATLPRLPDITPLSERPGNLDLSGILHLNTIDRFCNGSMKNVMRMSWWRNFHMRIV